MMRSIHKNNWMKTTALFIAVLFIWEAAAWAAPVPLRDVLSKSYTVQRDGIEIPIQVQIPPSLGKITEAFHALRSTNDAVLVHIEDAHGEPEAQKNTQAILEHLKREHGIQTFFLEGAWSKLDPALLRFSENPEENKKILAELTEKGIVGGPENFLEQNQVQGFGIEDLEFYKKNLAQFRAVMGAKADSDIFLNEMKSELLTKASQVLNSELADYFRQWSFHEEIQTDYSVHLRVLADKAQKHLGLDLNDAREQYDWPMLVRFFKLKELEKDNVQGAAHNQEKKRFQDWVQNKSLISAKQIDLILSDEARNANYDLRSFFEGFYEKALPKGFKFKDYPSLSREWGKQILAQELDVSTLLEEIEKLESQLIEKLVQTPEEKNLIAKYREYLLLKKLLHLKLSKDEWQRTSLQIGGRSPEKISKIIQTALNFYKIAEARDRAMVQRTIDWIEKEKIERAAIITGGFHSAGMSDLLKQKNISYIRIQPRITQIHGREDYLKLMAERSSLRAASPAEPDAHVLFPHYPVPLRDGLPYHSNVVARKPVLFEMRADVEFLRGGKYGIKAIDENERVALTDKNGSILSGKSATKEEAHRLGLPHMAAHIYLIDLKGRLLLQRRSQEKATSKGKWQVSASGHVDFGELPIAAAVREAEEEIGIRINSYRLKELTEQNGIFRDYKTEAGRNREYTTSYLYFVTDDEVELIRKNYNLYEADEFALIPFDFFEEDFRRAPENYSNTLSALFSHPPSQALYEKIKEIAAKDPIDFYHHEVTSEQKRILQELGFELDDRQRLVRSSAFRPLQLNHRFIFVRHGDTNLIELTEQDGLRRGQGASDEIPLNQLSALGINQAEGLPAKLEPLLSGKSFRFFRSPLGRVRDTAVPPEKTFGVKSQVRPGLVEFSSKPYENQTLADIRTRHGLAAVRVVQAYVEGNVAVQFPQGESLIHLLSRVKKELLEMDAALRSGETAVVFAHAKLGKAMKLLLDFDSKAFLPSGEADWQGNDIKTAEPFVLHEVSRDETRIFGIRFDEPLHAKLIYLASFMAMFDIAISFILRPFLRAYYPEWYSVLFNWLPDFLVPFAMGLFYATQVDLFKPEAIKQENILFRIFKLIEMQPILWLLEKLKVEGLERDKRIAFYQPFYIVGLLAFAEIFFPFIHENFGFTPFGFLPPAYHFGIIFDEIDLLFNGFAAVALFFLNRVGTLRETVQMITGDMKSVFLREEAVVGEEVDDVKSNRSEIRVLGKDEYPEGSSDKKAYWNLENDWDALILNFTGPKNYQNQHAQGEQTVRISEMINGGVRITETGISPTLGGQVSRVIETSIIQEGDKTIVQYAVSLTDRWKFGLIRFEFEAKQLKVSVKSFRPNQEGFIAAEGEDLIVSLALPASLDQAELFVDPDTLMTGLKLAPQTRASVSEWLFNSDLDSDFDALFGEQFLNRSEARNDWDSAIRQVFNNQYGFMAKTRLLKAWNLAMASRMFRERLSKASDVMEVQNAIDARKRQLESRLHSLLFFFAASLFAFGFVRNNEVVSDFFLEYPPSVSVAIILGVVYTGVIILKIFQTPKHEDDLDYLSSQLGRYTFQIENTARSFRSEARSAKKEPPQFKNLVGNGKGLGYLPFLRIWNLFYLVFKFWTNFRQKPWPIQIEGFENLWTEDRYILAGNHTGFGENLFFVTELYNLVGRMPFFIAQPEHLGAIEKFLIKAGGGLPIEKGQTVKKAKQFLNDNAGAILGVFPAGRSERVHEKIKTAAIASKSDSEIAKDFLHWQESAVAKIAVETGVAVVPFAIDSNIPRKWGAKELWHAFRLWQKNGEHAPPFYIHVRIGKSIASEGKTPEQLMEELKLSVVGNLRSIIEKSALQTKARSEMRIFNGYEGTPEEVIALAQKKQRLSPGSGFLLGLGGPSGIGKGFSAKLISGALTRAGYDLHSFEIDGFLNLDAPEVREKQQRSAAGETHDTEWDFWNEEEAFDALWLIHDFLNMRSNSPTHPVLINEIEKVEGKENLKELEIVIPDAWHRTQKDGSNRYEMKLTLHPDSVVILDGKYIARFEKKFRETKGKRLTDALFVLDDDIDSVREKYEHRVHEKYAKELKASPGLLEGKRNIFDLALVPSYQRYQAETSHLWDYQINVSGLYRPEISPEYPQPVVFKEHDVIDAGLDEVTLADIKLFSQFVLGDYWKHYQRVKSAINSGGLSEMLRFGRLPTAAQVMSEILTDLYMAARNKSEDPLAFQTLFRFNGPPTINYSKLKAAMGIYLDGRMMPVAELEKILDKKDNQNADEMDRHIAYQLLIAPKLIGFLTHLIVLAQKEKKLQTFSYYQNETLEKWNLLEKDALAVLQEAGVEVFEENMGGAYKARLIQNAMNIVMGNYSSTQYEDGEPAVRSEARTDESVATEPEITVVQVMDWDIARQGGMMTYVHHQNEAMVKKYVARIHVMYRSEKGATNGGTLHFENGSSIVLHPITEFRSYPYGFKKGLAWVKAVRDLAREIIQDEEVDVIHSHQMNSKFDFGLLGIDRTPVVFTNHMPYKMYAGLAYWLLPLRMIARGIMNWVAVWLVPTMLAYGPNALPVLRDKKVRLIEAGIDTDFFNPSLGDRESARKYFLGDDSEDFMIFYPARFLPRKGQIDLVDVAEKLMSKKGKFKIVLMGPQDEDPSYAQEIREKIRLKKLEDFFVLLPSGDLHQVRDGYAASDVVVFPTYFESPGLMSLEAQSMQKPVVSYLSEGVTHTLHSDSTVGVKKGDTAAFADAVWTLMQDPSQRKFMGIAGRKFVVDRFSAEANIDAHFNLYRKLSPYSARSEHRYFNTPLQLTADEFETSWAALSADSEEKLMPYGVREWHRDDVLTGAEMKTQKGVLRAFYHEKILHGHSYQLWFKEEGSAHWLRIDDEMHTRNKVENAGFGFGVILKDQGLSVSRLFLRESSQSQGFGHLIAQWLKDYAEFRQIQLINFETRVPAVLRLMADVLKWESLSSEAVSFYADELGRIPARDYLSRLGAGTSLAGLIMDLSDWRSHTIEVKGSGKVLLDDQYAGFFKTSAGDEYKIKIENGWSMRLWRKSGSEWEELNFNYPNQLAAVVRLNQRSEMRMPKAGRDSMAALRFFYREILNGYLEMMRSSFRPAEEDAQKQSAYDAVSSNLKDLLRLMQGHPVIRRQLASRLQSAVRMLGTAETKRNPVAAETALMQAVDDILNKLYEPYLRRQINYAKKRYAVNRIYRADDGRWMLRQGVYHQVQVGKSGNVPHTIKKDKAFDSLWELLRSLDHQLEKMATERKKIDSMLAVIKEVRIYLLESQSQPLPDDLKEKLEALLRPLSAKWIIEKQLAQQAIEFAAQITDQEIRSRVIGFLNHAEALIQMRATELDSMIDSVENQRGLALKKHIEGRNIRLAKAIRILSAQLDIYLNPSQRLGLPVNARDIQAKIAGIIRDVDLIKEPDLEGLIDLLRGIQSNFNGYAREPGDKTKAAVLRYVKSVRGLIELSSVRHEMLSRFEKEKRGLDLNSAQDAQDTIFKNLFQEQVRRRTITGARHIAGAWFDFYAFAREPLNVTIKGERVSNPQFHALRVLAIILGSQALENAAHRKQVRTVPGLVDELKKLAHDDLSQSAYQLSDEARKQLFEFIQTTFKLENKLPSLPAQYRVRSEMRSLAISTPTVFSGDGMVRTLITERVAKNVFSVEFISSMSRSEFQLFFDRAFPRLVTARQQQMREVALRKAGLALQVNEGLIVGADLAGTEGFWDAAKLFLNGQKMAVLGTGDSALTNVRYFQNVADAKAWLQADKITAWVSPDEEIEPAELRRQVSDLVIMTRERLSRLYSGLGLESLAAQILVSRQILSAA